MAFVFNFKASGAYTCHFDTGTCDWRFKKNLMVVMRNLLGLHFFPRGTKGCQELRPAPKFISSSCPSI
jgi:hypothetical protein